MKTLASSLIFLFLLSVFWVAAGETGDNPIAVSPGSETGPANVSQSCPTFSWSAVEQASSYRVSVFQAPDAVARSYEDMAWSISPVIIKEIPGPALSWTLPLEERLQSGIQYVWYVQAMDGAGIGFGSSAGRNFKVEQEVACAGMDGKMEARLKSRGVGEDVIAGALNDWKSSVSQVSVQSAALDQPHSKVIGNPAVGAKNTFLGQMDGGTEGASNTFYGQAAGAGITTGIGDTFIGLSSGTSNTTGSYNTFVGSAAGYSNTTANSNTFIGFAAGRDSTASANTFLGGSAGRYNTTGNSNTFIGSAAGYSNTTANSNTFLGYNAGYNNTASSNSFIGSNAGDSNTTGESNTFLGYNAGQANTTGNSNTFFGYNAGYNNIAHNNTFIGSNAGYSNITGTYNTFLGYNAGNANNTGTHNTFLGYYAGDKNTTGHENTFIGVSAGYSNTTGYYNTFIGLHSGYNTTTGDTNTFIGKQAGFTNITGAENTFIGNLAGFHETGSNKLYIDNSATSDPLIYGEFDNDIVNINGNLGIGTKTPGYPVEVSRTGANASIVLNRTDGAKNYVNATQYFGNFGTVNNFPVRLTVNSTARMTLNTDNSLSMKSGASCTAGGVWTNASSLALKENIAALNSDEAATTLQSLNPVKYNYKAEKDENHIGFIAEEVPELVAMKDRKSLSPMDIVAVLTKVTQDQQNQLQEQKRINENLARNMQEQQQIIEKMKMEFAELKMKRSE